MELIDVTSFYEPLSRHHLVVDRSRFEQFISRTLATSNPLSRQPLVPVSNAVIKLRNCSSGGPQVHEYGPTSVSA